MKFNKYSFAILSLLIFFWGCDSFLDRPPLTQANDETAWVSENNLRLYANKFLPDFFIGI